MDDVSVCIKELPIGANKVAPDSDVGEFDFLVFIKFDTFPLLFLSLQIYFQ